MADKMTAAEARSFDGHSERNAMLIMSQLKCECEPYITVLTYNRWQALGRQVKKSEKSIRIPTIIYYDEENNDGEIIRKKKRWISCLFCECQTKPK